MPSTLSGRLRRVLPRVRWTRRRVITWSAVAVVIVGLLVWAGVPTRASYSSTARMLTVMTGPDGTTPVRLDTTFFEPRGASAAHPVPAVLLAHGFGGTKASVVDQAKHLADRGYAVLTWTAEGFGASGGQIHLDSPDWEVRDGSRLIDWLAARPEIVKDGPNDPRVAAVGGSYGGGFSLMLAGDDPRVDAIVPMITWNNLANAFLPDDVAGGGAADGVWKKAWAGLFFGDSGSGGPIGSAPTDAQCGRFAADVCRTYLSIASTGKATPAEIALLERSSPASIINRIKAPTLLIQGEADTLFPLSEADANERGIAANGTPVSVAWFTGGHDGGAGPQSDQDRLTALTDQWLDFYLEHTGPKPPSAFTYSRIAGLDANSNGLVASAFRVPSYPGIAGNGTTGVSVAGRAQAAANPPGSSPAALSSLPGTGGGLASFVQGVVSEVPGQHADFYSRPLASSIDVVGAPTVQIEVASPTGSAVVFVKLYDVDP
ncbi:MAG TPA: alpha/beta fold hydrolase, partial [Micromonosporaceae bacterium]